MLYRKYRPKTWTNVIGQENIVRALRGAVSVGRIGHAYLFAGPRGTGKTTLARILAKAANCTASINVRPCDKCASCAAVGEGRSLDVIEIDAASNRSIDDIRALKEAVGTATTGGAYRVYLIDEAHMLTKEAANAFLKLLEEPPAHIIFVLATTEAHKIIPTVLSRVQRFDFRKLTQSEISKKLSIIAKAEERVTHPEVIASLAASSDGALRDAEVMLTKLYTENEGEITSESVQRVLGIAPTVWNGELAEAISVGDRIGALAVISRASESGTDADQFIRGFLEYLRRVMINKIDKTTLMRAQLALSEANLSSIKHLTETMDGKLLVRAIHTFTKARTELRMSPIPFFPLELAVIELTEKS